MIFLFNSEKNHNTLHVHFSAMMIHMKTSLPGYTSIMSLDIVSILKQDIFRGDPGTL